MALIQTPVDSNKNNVRVTITCYFLASAFLIYLTPAYLLYVLERCECLLRVSLIGADYYHRVYSVIAIKLQAVVGRCCRCVIFGTFANNSYSCVIVGTPANDTYSCIIVGTLANDTYS
jgi:hypothetical protein